MNSVKKLKSSIPGQTEMGAGLNVEMMMIAMLSGMLMFLTSLVWSQFLDSAVVAIQEKAGNSYPMPLARLFSAIIISGLVFSIFLGLYKWEEKVRQELDEKN